MYDLDRRSAKWWKKVFFKILNMAIVNASTIYSEVHHKKLELLQFLVPLAEQMISIGKENSETLKRKRSSGRPSKKRKHMLNIGEHMPEVTTQRRRCVQCSANRIEKRVKIICASCKVALCSTCFALYHK